MQTQRLLFVAILFIGVAISTSAQEPSIDDLNLSESAKSAVRGLQNVKLFALGGIGIRGIRSKGQMDFDALLRDPRAITAFRFLVGNATPEGTLYALLGLKILNCDCFEAELERFKTFPDGAGDVLDSPEKIGHIRRASGCIMYTEHRLKVAEDIANGRFSHLRPPPESVGS